MTTVKQTALGSHNQQVTKIFNRPFDPVDICAEKIAEVLAKIDHIDFLSPPATRLTPPNIAEKNKKNAIDSANSHQIEKTYALWDEITEAIRADSTGVTANNYQKAAFILNQLYLAKFQGEFPSFKIHAIGIYCENTGSGIDDAHVLLHLIHYMYLSCQVGLTP